MPQNQELVIDTCGQVEQNHKIQIALWKNAFYFNYSKHNIWNLFLRNKLNHSEKYGCCIGVIDSFNFISDVKCTLQMLWISNFQPLFIFGALLFDLPYRKQCLFRVYQCISSVPINLIFAWLYSTRIFIQKSFCC